MYQILPKDYNSDSRTDSDKGPMNLNKDNILSSDLHEINLSCFFYTSSHPLSLRQFAYKPINCHTDYLCMSSF